jgi:hypothetical protein
MWYFKALNRLMLLPLAELVNREASILDDGYGTGGWIKALQTYEPQWKIYGFARVLKPDGILGP